MTAVSLHSFADFSLFIFARDEFTDVEGRASRYVTLGFNIDMLSSAKEGVSWLGFTTCSTTYGGFMLHLSN